jgi:predicted DsbA family dithiol-disulfide isomerase
MTSCNSDTCDNDNKSLPLTNKNSKELVIDIISDFICPWCLVADSRLNKAIAEVAPNFTIGRRWLPFELNPHMPEQGMDRKEYRAQKFGSWARSLELDAQVQAAAKNDGIAFRHDLMTRTPNTTKAHRLTWLFSLEGKGTVIAERLFKAYFFEGKDIGDTATLADLADQVGMNRAKVAAFLESEKGLKEVKALQQQNALLGIQGVPLIIIGDRAISGAQPMDVFADALKKAINDRVSK